MSNRNNRNRCGRQSAGAAGTKNVPILRAYEGYSITRGGPHSRSSLKGPDTHRTVLNKVTPSGPGWAQGLGKHILILVITERYKVLLDKLGPLEVLRHISLKDTGVMEIPKARGLPHALPHPHPQAFSANASLVTGFLALFSLKYSDFLVLPLPWQLLLGLFLPPSRSG